MYFLAFSGGLDSTTLLAKLHADLRQSGTGLTLVFFDYGSKHNPFELASAQAISSFYGYEAFFDCVDLKNTGIFRSGDSALMAGNEEAVPSTAYTEAGSLEATVVPGRNLIMASILASKAEAHYLSGNDRAAEGRQREANVVAMAVHGGDHALYPDCRPVFIHRVDQAIKESTESCVCFHAPFVSMTKAEIVKLGLELGAPLHLTRSCYQAQGKACGECGTCRERLAAFKANGATDPADYA